MPEPSDQDPGWKALEAKVSSLLEPLAAELGPRVCAHGDWSDCDVRGERGAVGCAFNDTQPKPGSMPMVKGFVLVTTVEDAASDDPIVGSLSAPGMRRHEILGLLHMALFEGA